MGGGEFCGEDSCGDDDSGRNEDKYADDDGGGDDLLEGSSWCANSATDLALVCQCYGCEKGREKEKIKERKKRRFRKKKRRNLCITSVGKC